MESAPPNRPSLQLDTQQHQGGGQQQQGHYHHRPPTEQPFSPPALSSQHHPPPSDFDSASTLTSLASSPHPPTNSYQAQQRSFSHGRRTQSMKESASSSSSSAAPALASAGAPILGATASSVSTAFGPASSGGSVLAGVLAGMDGNDAATTLARRNNTVSTASSRLVRLERTRARLALQGAGLSEEDQNFYVPPSPARGGPYAVWSDIGHGGSSSTASLPLSGGGMAAFERNGGAAAGSAEGEAAWRRAEQLQQQQQQQQPMATATQQQQQAAAPAEPKRSSFVVLRGGKGDSALTERRAHQPTTAAPSSTISPPPAPLPEEDSSTSADQPLRHKNSLKPFLEQERSQAQGGRGGEVVEDWEKGLMDERKSAAEGGLLNAGGSETWEEGGDDWRNTDPYASLATPPLSSSFPSQLSSPFSSTSHARANTFSAHQTRRNNTTDPWLPPSAAPGIAGAPVLAAEDDPNLIRRHQSLTSFRQREPSIEQAMGVLSSSPGSNSWADHGAPVEDHQLHQPLGRTASGGRSAYGSLALGAAPSISGFGSRTRSGTSPAPLTLHHSASLGHNAPPRTPHAATAGLAHSNSLSSHPYGGNHGGGATGLSHSNSLSSRSDGGTDASRRIISPVMNAFPGARSPWSPTEEETKQLSFAASGAAGGAGGGTGSGSLSRGGSGSSRGSHAAGGSSHEGPAGGAPAYASMAGGLNGRFADEVRRLDEGLGAMQLGAPGTPSSSTNGGGRAPSTSPHPPPLPHGTATNAARRLPPLMTGADVLLGAGPGPGGVMGGRAGPASAAAFVPPIGHSHFFGGAGGGGLDGISENGGGGPFPPQQQNGLGGPLVPSLTAAHVAQQQQQNLQQSNLLPSSFPLLPAGFDPSSAPPPASSLGPLRGNLTAHPGAPSSLDWARQKEFLLGASGAGTTPTSSSYNNAPSSAATIVPGPFSNAPVTPGAEWPPAGGPAPGAQAQGQAQGVDLAVLQKQLQLQHVQQQQQIHALQSQMAEALSAMDAMRAQGAVVPPSFEAGLRAAAAAAGVSGAPGGDGAGAAGAGAGAGGEGANVVAETPIDVNGLIAKKGYNPGVFDLRPKNARFFVIKSYTEEDVHKSLKYEIWASTDLGNKRLDRAFRESADKGPIYLFFSVNASGHFAGMAQMLTPVDYSMSSNVWASDKWKGVLKVRWIYIKDVPLSALRHIRLSNTPENKPVTSSRDTQEVPYDAGLEVLRIIASYQSRTSLLQDYAWYEASSRLQQQQQAQAQAAAAQGVDASLLPSHGDIPLYQPGHHYHPNGGGPNHHQQQQQGPPPHSTPSPQPPTLTPQQQGLPPPVPSPRQPQSQPQTQPSPKQAARNPQAGGRRFWNRGGGVGGGSPPVPPLPPQQQQQQQGYYQAPPHLHQQQQQGGPYPPQQHVGNGVAY
ncbi:hypothetical protein JCM6882_008791 [Rhodosporidiobolus microsporus]